ncbi:unnamed protein product [Clonostachys solani]|uniref:Transcription factor domain-containing protein n=1 Tax=Clonostachys solani TaxID=160281 RepID=A0A9N9ZIS3_9HYPO|nr:unnamed protein product [Clonostachys solani]
MLFVSCPYVSLESLNSLGFRTVKEARAEFYSRAKTLFDLQTDLDDQARSQGALMLTYRTLEFNDRSATFWLSVSIHYAKNIEAYCYNEKPDQSERIYLKRLWWCCVLRDKVLALALRQAPLISPEAFDFSHGGFVFGDFAHEVGSSRPHSATGRKKSQLRPDQIKALLSKLDNWYQNTYVEFRTASISTDAHDSIILFSNVVYTYYYITETLMELDNSGLVKYLPITFISFAATPFVWDLLQARMLNSDDRAQGLQKDLKAHLDVMGGFNDLYENAESTVKCIKHIVEHVKTKESLPQRKDFVQGPPQTGLNSPTQSRDRGIITWKDFILEDPQTYLRIVLTVEYSLAHGHCPSEADFPKSLRTPPHPAINTSGWETLGSSVDANWFSEAFDDIIINYSDTDA